VTLRGSVGASRGGLACIRILRGNSEGDSDLGD
jgi:hypothetical protein